MDRYHWQLRRRPLANGVVASKPNSCLALLGSTSRRGWPSGREGSLRIDDQGDGTTSLARVSSIRSEMSLRPLRPAATASSVRRAPRCVCTASRVNSEIVMPRRCASWRSRASVSSDSFTVVRFMYASISENQWCAVATPAGTRLVGGWIGTIGRFGAGRRQMGWWLRSRIAVWLCWGPLLGGVGRRAGRGPIGCAR